MAEQEKADLLQGAAEIGHFLRMKPRRVHYLIEVANLPAFKVGGRICATREGLRAWINGQAHQKDQGL